MKGKRFSGRFAIADIKMNLLFEKSIRIGSERLSARSTTLIKENAIFLSAV